MREGARRICSGLQQAALSGESVDIFKLLHHEAFLVIGNSAVGEESEWLLQNGDRMKDAFLAAGMPGFERTEEGKVALACLHEFSTNVLARDFEKQGAFAPNSVAAKLMAKNKDGTDALDDQKKHDQLMNFMFAVRIACH
jgi:hypothetical protein